MEADEVEVEVGGGRGGHEGWAAGSERGWRLEDAAGSGGFDGLSEVEGRDLGGGGGVSGRCRSFEGGFGAASLSTCGVMHWYI